MSEGGIGWVAMLLDRLDNIVDRSRLRPRAGTMRPADVLQRNFWFCTLDDPSTIDTRHRIGVENIMVEVDYPHGDGTWPDTQLVIEKYWGHIPPAELRAMCSENAAALYRHPLPDVVLPRATDRRPHDVRAHRREARSPTCRRARRSCSSPARCGARATTTTSPATSPCNHGDGTLLCNPWLLTWDEFRPERRHPHRPRRQRASKATGPCRSGIPLHLELHKARPA